MRGGDEEKGAAKAEGGGQIEGEGEAEVDSLSSPGRIMVLIGDFAHHSDRAGDLGPNIPSGQVNSLKSHLRYGKWKSKSYVIVL